ncbi:hypothetical protein IAT38_003751 [Cryptococcus sp. DSM 104549]
MTAIKSDWTSAADAFKASLAAKIPADLLLPETALSSDQPLASVLASALSPKEQDIQSLDATALAEAIAAKTYTSVDVLKAYARAAVIVHQRTNCLMDFFLDEAMDRAKWLDEQLEKTGKTVGPLHGVPISVKDHLGLKGHMMTGGFLSWVDKYVAPKDSSLVAALRAGGAVFWVKTTNPQGIMHLETKSFMGTTTNPYNAKLTSGGSSGGEGALVGGGGSPLGIGTDIGGSIRSPCAHNGLFGFKPTSIRLPKGGNKSAQAGNECIVGAIGPMGRSIRDLELFINVVLASEPWKLDPSSVRMPWRPAEVAFIGGEKPKVGVMWEDGVVKPLPPMRRALEYAVEKLKAAGVEVVEYPAFKQKEGWEILSKLYYTDGAKRTLGFIEESGEPVLPLTQWVIDQGAKELPATGIWDLVARRDMYRSEYNAHFQSLGVDVILCPPAPGPAPQHETSKYWSYTGMFNLVDYPAGIFPTGLFVDPKLDGKEEREFLGEEDALVWKDYDAEIAEGAPVSLQVAGSRWEDEKVMAAMDVISSIVRK